MQKYKILLVEDDINLGNVLLEFLVLKNFDVDLAENGILGLELYRSNKYDLCLFDVMLPQKDGFTLAKEIRNDDKEIPIIFLTAKSMQHDKIEGLKLGADDYITKPFNTEELLLRINAIIKRLPKFSSNKVKFYKIGNYNFYYEKRILIFKNKEKKLTYKECELLKLLCDHNNQVVTRQKALNKIWNEETYFTSRSMDVYITKLRNYLKQDENIQILNIHGTGFKLYVG